MTTQERTRLQNAPVLTVLQNMSPEDFQAWAQKNLDAAHRIIDTISKDVSDGNVQPLQAGGILACAVGQLFGYTDFHGIATPANMNGLSQLYSGGARSQ